MRRLIMNRNLIPIRTVEEYNVVDENIEKLCRVVRADGEYLTDALPISWCHFITSAVNARYINGLRKPETLEPDMLTMRILGEPMAKYANIVVDRKSDGTLRATDSPAYVKSIKEAIAQDESIFVHRWCQLPIIEPVSVACIFRVTGKMNQSLPAMQQWCLDLLVAGGIITKANCGHIVNMDGSRAEKAKIAETLIIVRRAQP